MTGRGSFLPFAQPDLDGAELAEIEDTLKSGWITTGPKVRQFEADFAAAVTAKHALALNSATAAMHIALEAVGIQRGDEVITTPYTFASTAEVIRYFDAKPVLADICTEDFNIDPAQIETAITPRTKAIIPVHIAGLPVDMKAIYRIAQEHHLAVIEDAAHAFPSKFDGQLIGSSLFAADEVKSLVCFSFYATKTITTGEGGMLCTGDPVLAERCHIMSLHGISQDAWKRYTEAGSWYYEIIAPGYKYNMTDIAAAMGLAQLRKAETMWLRRCEIARRYNEVFSASPELQIPCDPSDRQHAWQLYMLRLNLDRLSIDRKQFIEKLKSRNIGTSVHFIPLHLHPYYRETYGYKPEDCPVAYREYQREVSLPIYSKMSDQDLQDVIEAVMDITDKHRR